MSPTPLLIALGAGTLIAPASSLVRRGWRKGGSAAAIAAYVASVAVVLACLFAFRPELVSPFLGLMVRATLPVRVAVFLYLLLVAARALRFIAGDRANGDMHARIAAGVRRAAGGARLAGIAAGEVSALYYALFSWRARASVPRDHEAFGCHQCDGHLATLSGLLAFLALDTTVIHLLVAPHAAAVGWALTGWGGYAMLWALADHRAVALRPILVSRAGILLRAGLRGTAFVPLDAIRSVSTEDGPRDRRTYRRMTLLARPDFVAELTTPVTVHGMLGSARSFTALGFAIDEPGALAASLSRLGVTVAAPRERDRGDFVDRLRDGLRVVVRRAPVADALARELSLLACAFFFWRLTPPADARRFTIHRRSGYGAVLATLIGVSCIETYVVDALVRGASKGVANVLLALSLYTVVWFFGDFQALRIRPIVLGEDTLFVRAGLRREARIPLRDVETIETIPLAGEPRRAADYVRCTAFGPAEVLLHLRSPARFEQMIGRAKDVVRVGLAIDDEEAFRRSVLAAAERARRDDTRAPPDHVPNPSGTP